MPVPAKSRCKEEASPPAARTGTSAPPPSPARKVRGGRGWRRRCRRSSARPRSLRGHGHSAVQRHGVVTDTGGRAPGGTRSRAARSTSTAWGRSSCSGRLRWMRSPRSTWARRSGPSCCGHVDQEAQLDPVAAGESQLLEDPAVGRRLAGQGLAYPEQLGEEELEHGTGHQLGDPSAPGGVAVQRPRVIALDQRDMLGRGEAVRAAPSRRPGSCWPRRRRGRR